MRTQISRLHDVCLKTIGWSKATYYRWLKRYQQHGWRGLESQSRRPKRMRSPMAGHEMYNTRCFIAAVGFKFIDNGMLLLIAPAAPLLKKLWRRITYSREV
ncbi:helix-turn-helix domain-containing protein [Candidatus Spongiihabitans sp.]|uniref:helix-turn-helix domain-containing protein n=1 Tax=Candidatus Spongiihabitans sp. TaxID=3101308 RepID=UPI003C79FF32